MLDSYRKKLLYISTHRGTKEGDLIVGGFARAHLPHFSQEEVEEWAHLLDYPDAEIMEWIKTPSQSPKEISVSLVEKMKEYVSSRKTEEGIHIYN